MQEYAGVPLAAEQKRLTPLQRMVIGKEAMRQKEKAEEDSKGPGRGGGPTMNSAQTGGGRMSGETVEYVNEGAD